MQTTGSIKSIIHGVSTQSPRERVEGQCWEMLNFIPDPVDGVFRRPGCRYDGGGQFPDTGGLYSWKELSLGTDDYFVGCSAGNIKVVRQADGVLLDVYQAPSSIAYFASGINAVTAIGEYAIMASPVKPAITNISGEPTRAPVNKHFCMVEVRQGVYGGTYRIARKSTGAVLASFTVPNGSTATDIEKAQPQYIADQLRAGLVSAGLTAVAISGVIGIESSDLALIRDLAAEDGIYNSRMRLIYDFWTDTATLPATAPDSLVVRIGNIDRSEGDFYMKFRQHGDLAAYLNPRAGQWVECRAPSAHIGGSLTATSMPRLMYVYNNKAYIGTGPEIRAQINADGGPTLVALDYGTRAVGDVDTNDDPLFVGREIKWLGTFQDRLVVLCEDAITMSRIADYLEFYRATVVSLLDDDRVNMSSTYNKKDVLSGAELYDRNLIVIGTKTHYVVPGKVPVTPASGMAVTAAYDSAPTVHPVTLGDAVYFCSVSESNADLLSITTKDQIDSSTVGSVGGHVDGYVPGDITKLVAATKLNMIFALSASGELYGYRTAFLDRKRVLSSWFRMHFGHREGAKLVGVDVDNTRLRLLFTRAEAGSVYYAVASLDLDRKGYLSENGQYYLDFWKAEDVVEGDTVRNDNRTAAVCGADFRVLDVPTGNLHGSVAVAGNAITHTATKGITGAITGQLYPYEYVPTLPIPRDRDGRPITIGKLTVGQMQFTYSVGSRFDIRVKDKYRDTTLEHRASRVGTPDLLVGRAYIGAGKALFPVASSEPDARVTISGKDHFPLVLTFIDWKGQYFKHGRSM